MTTPLYAAILGLMMIALSIHVIKGRRKFGAALGDADNIEMKRRIRAQGNLAEYAPIFLILLGYAEYGGFPAWAVHACGMIFIAGRVMHAYSVLKAEQYVDHQLTGNPVWRIRGMMCTFNLIALLAIAIFIQTALAFLL